MKSDSLVSVIIPTFNRAHIIREAVESVLEQTYQPLEVIVVDDGSSDNTSEVLSRFGSAITVIRQKNAGPAAARNRGIAASNGAFVAFLDSDDLWVPAKIERQVALLDSLGESVPCCLTNIRIEDSSRQTSSFQIAWMHPKSAEGLWLNVDEVLATRFVLFNQGVMIRRGALDKVGTFDEGLRLLEDLELSLRLSLEGSWAFISEPLVIWRETPGSCTQQARVEGTIETELLAGIRQKHAERIERLMPRRGRLTEIARREAARSRRQLRAISLKRQSSFGASILGQALNGVEKYRSAIFRRSPLFPQMEVEPAARRVFSLETSGSAEVSVGNCS